MKSLRGRFLLVFGTACALALAGFAGAVFWLVQRAVERDLVPDPAYTDAVLEDRCLGLAGALAEAFPEDRWRQGEVGDLSGWLSRYFAGSGQPLFKQVFDGRGGLKGRSLSFTVDLPLTPAARAPLAGTAQVQLETVFVPSAQRTARVATRPLSEDGPDDPGAFAYVQTGIWLPDTDARLAQLRRGLVLAGLGALALALTGGTVALRQWNRPVREFATAAGRIQPQTLARERLPGGHGDPALDGLARAVNAMLDRLEESYGAQRRFAADAAHEMSTPLTVLRGELDVILRRPRATDEYLETLGSCREEIERLSQLTENLLTLASADAGRAVVAREPLELRALSRDVAARLAPLAAERDVAVVIAEGPPTAVRADRLAVEQILRNLLENALRHTPVGGTVSILVQPEASQVALTVADTGDGIAPEHLPRLFDRFYRADRSRTRRMGGAGLGLAIVKTLVEAHGGTVGVESTGGQGTRFTVRLDAAIPPGPGFRSDPG
jgi:two-component system heavy metal sensor histidine kinase CusS